jgi:hypothetical protein
MAAYVALVPPAIMYIRLHNQLAYELPVLARAGFDAEGRPNPNVEQIKLWIERHSRPGDEILAPPFYAFLTGRRIWGNYSEIFIWTMKYRNDAESGRPDGEGAAKIRAMAEAIRERRLPLVIIEMGQTGVIPEIRAALEASYRPLIETPYPTLNTRLGVFIPAEPARGVESGSLDRPNAS